MEESENFIYCFECGELLDDGDYLCWLCGTEN
jgi:hypothetical protein